MPWRNTRDPYRIWLSEIMLQQTRAAAAIPYYEAFLRRFPDAESLARAPESEVLAAWSGLGYYSRARNLRKAAIAISGRGAFPSDYETIRALPGVGPYTAAAVASIAFGLAHAVLDGNVVRVVSRLFADGSASRPHFQEIADDLLDRKSPGDFNQAMMELGATICLPREPMCLLCPVARHCEASSTGRQNQFPVLLKKPKPVEESVEVVVVRRGSRVLMKQRAAGERRLAGFWELPDPKDLPGLISVQTMGNFRHTIVHHRYTVTVLAGRASRAEGMEWVIADGTGPYPLTTIARKALDLCAKG